MTDTIFTDFRTTTNLTPAKRKRQFETLARAAKTLANGMRDPEVFIASHLFVYCGDEELRQGLEGSRLGYLSFEDAASLGLMPHLEMMDGGGEPLGMLQMSAEQWVFWLERLASTFATRAKEPAEIKHPGRPDGGLRPYLVRRLYRDLNDYSDAPPLEIVAAIASVVLDRDMGVEEVAPYL